MANPETGVIIGEAPATRALQSADLDLQAAQRFLEILDPSGVFTFVTRTDKQLPSGTKDKLSSTLHGTLQDHCAELAARNLLGAGVFVMVNEGDGIVHEGFKTCRSSASVKKIRAYTLDLDGSPLQPLLDEMPWPHLVVETSPGKYHVYWLVDSDEISPDDRQSVAREYREQQLHLARKFGGDPNACDLPRILRIPGFFHQKNEPVMVRLLEDSRTVAAHVESAAG